MLHRCHGAVARLHDSRPVRLVTPAIAVLVFSLLAVLLGLSFPAGARADGAVRTNNDGWSRGSAT